MCKVWCFLFLTAMLLLCQNCKADAFTFSTIHVPNSTNTVATGINDKGQIVGYYFLGGAVYGFLLDGGGFTAIAVPGATSTTLAGINDRGQIVGSYQNADGINRSFLLSNGDFSPISVPGETDTLAKWNQ